jgi:ParB family transcriptional regulator, chromosome partitioning protein
MAKTQQKGLGRGFDSLLPQNFDESLLLDSSDKIEKIAIDKLVPNQYQPRKEFADEAIQELADSIKEYGVLQPLIVTPHEGGYMLIAGERRWRASRLAGQKTVPAIIRTLKELERLEVALIENVQRVDLSPLEQAESIEYLHRQFGTSYTEIAKRLGKGNSTVVNIARLMQLPDDAKQALRSGKISEGHARAVLALKGDTEKQTALLEHITKHGWTVRQAEQFVVSVREGHQEAKKTPERMRTETPATKRLGKRLGAPVFIRRTARGGKLEVSFKSDDELDNILALISN